MKSFKTLACLTAVLLASTVGVTSCKDKNEGEKNGQQVQQKEAVKTEFAITLPSQATKGGARRMPAAIVQRDGLSQFQGITDIVLVPFSKQAAIISTDTRLGNANIELDSDVESSDASRPSAAKVYSDVTIPLTTASFLFYGRSAATGGSGSDEEKKFTAGSLIAAGLYAPGSANQPSGISFSLESIVDADDVAGLTASSVAGGKLLAYLNSIARVSDGAEAPATAKAWYEYTDADEAGMGSMFAEFSRMSTLSSFAVARTLTDLYKSFKPLPASNLIATAVKAAIRNSDYIDTDELDNNDNVVLVSAYNNFPEQHYLPQGAIAIRWNSTSNMFTTEDAYSNRATPDRYVYPAQLWYYANSRIVTSNTSKKSMYDNANEWGAILTAHENGESSVNSLTRAVAVEDTIQYAVARLDVKVKIASGDLKDNSDNANGASLAEDITPNVAGFPISAVFVGGQKNVGFDFTPTGATEYTIYDKVMTDEMNASTSWSAVNHTLVLENATEIVRVAVEMTNNTGKDFYGYGNQLIPVGGKFYVVGELNATNLKDMTPAVNPTTPGQVFKQDYTTTAEMTLGNLRHAYNGLPDLRTPQLELGFSVNLSWKRGNVYEVAFE